MNQFDISRYLGKWYDIAHMKTFPWQDKCAFSTAEYSLNSDKTKMIIKNTCLDLSNNPIYSRTGEATPTKTPSKLRVIFNDGLPADPEGEYWVLWTDYDNYSIVSSGSNKKYVWLLSRRPVIRAKDVAPLLQIVKDNGYNPNLLYSNPKSVQK